MGLKSGSPTSYRHQLTSVKRHQRVGVGENYEERRAYKTQMSEIQATGTSFLGKIVDFFLGSKVVDNQKFESNAHYVGRGRTIEQYHKGVEQGLNHSSEPLTDDQLFAILNKVK